MADEDPNILLAEDDGANGEEDIENEDDDDDDDDEKNSEGDDMDDSEEDNDDEESGDDDDDDDDSRNDEEKMKNMEIFIRTFHNGNYDIQFEAALSLDRSGIEPDMHTQALYNKPDNWSERNRIGLGKVKRQLQSYIHSVSGHDKYLDLHLIHSSARGQLLDNEEPFVWHEPILDDYWEQLKDAIFQLGLVTKVGSIRIVNVEIKKERMAALVEILSSGKATNSSTYIQFYNTNLCGESIIYLSKLVETSLEMQDFCLRHNRIDDMESARRLSRALKSHARIRKLYLAHCDLGSSPEILSVILQSNVLNINLNNNNINSWGVVKIAEYLEGDPPIRCIDLEHNRLNDDDVILISHALKRNTNLTFLNLVGNGFSSIGVKALLTCVFDSSSLNALSESNHTLTRIEIFSWVTDNNLAGCMDRMLHLDRTEKILHALQDKDSLLQYLANVPVELIPEVLAFPLRRVVDEHQHKHLNILYSTMRWWNMPMLYSYQNCSGNMMSDRKRNRDD
jgi:hypothetical protein